MRVQAAIDAILLRLERDLSRNLYYHSVSHTRDVLARTEALAKSEGITEPESLDLLRTAAAYHDSGFLINNRDHERLGCKLVRAELPAYGFTSEQIERICGMIRATKVPQKPRNHLEQIICDADLDYLGRDDFYAIGRRLFKELKAFRLLETEAEWNDLQIKFLRAHSYWTATNKQERAEKKAGHLVELEGGE